MVKLCLNFCIPLIHFNVSLNFFLLFHENSDRPEWLLFEIEQNLTIRRIQIEIANRMIDPPAMNDTYAKHSVMQLNMGEGKCAKLVFLIDFYLKLCIFWHSFSHNFRFFSYFKVKPLSFYRLWLLFWQTASNCVKLPC